MLLAEVVARLNELFQGENFRDDQIESWAHSLVQAVLTDPNLRAQAEANSIDQFLASPDLHDALLLAVAETSDAHSRMTKLFNEKGTVEQGVLDILGRYFYLEVHQDDQLDK